MGLVKVHKLQVRLPKICLWRTGSCSSLNSKLDTFLGRFKNNNTNNLYGAIFRINETRIHPRFKK